MKPIATLRNRWDIDPAARAGLPFDAAMALLNMRRLELAAILLIANDLIESWLHPHLISVGAEITVGTISIAAARFMRHHGTVRAQWATVMLAIVAIMATTQWGTVLLSTRGTISTGYLIRLLTVTLLFVVPPRPWAALLWGSFASYCVIVPTLPAGTPAKIVAIANAVVVLVITQVTGWLIYAARRSDHEQRVLIQEQNGRLAARNVELDQLMAITAHDLRSPLYGLRNLFDLARRRAASEPALPLRVMGDGIASIDAMLALVTRLLDAHQAEHAPLADIVREDLREHLRAAARRIAPRAEAAAVALDLRLPDTPLCARFDSGALTRILDNLLDNAVRFSPAGATLSLIANADDRHARIAIEDRGPGVDQPLRETMFDKFRRGAPSAAGGKPGAGMGLFIAATFAARIDADLSYRPAVPSGSIFELSLPIVQA